MSDLECPYCGAENEVCHDDGFGLVEDVTHEMECHQCEKNFAFHTTIHLHFRPSRADCLNGADHKWSEWRTQYLIHRGGEGQYRYCDDCGKRETREVGV